MILILWTIGWLITITLFIIEDYLSKYKMISWDHNTTIEATLWGCVFLMILWPIFFICLIPTIIDTIKNART